jgi:hypothetical protein
MRRCSERWRFFLGKTLSIPGLNLIYARKELELAKHYRDMSRKTYVVT